TVTKITGHPQVIWLRIGTIEDSFQKAIFRGNKHQAAGHLSMACGLFNCRRAAFRRAAQPPRRVPPRRA
ncbi:MAG: hypothetical protein RSC06_15620, partial [Clostridia bacterium]